MSDLIQMTLYRRSTHFTHSKRRVGYDISDLVIDDSVTLDRETNFSATEFNFKMIFEKRMNSVKAIIIFFPVLKKGGD